MEDTPQEGNHGYFEVRLDNTLYGFEFIKHRNGHLYLYINGSKTDVIFPRSIDPYNIQPYGYTFTLEKFMNCTDKLIYSKSVFVKEFIKRLTEF